MAEKRATASWSSLFEVLIRSYSLLFVKNNPSEMVAGMLAFNSTPDAKRDVPLFGIDNCVET